MVLPCARLKYGGVSTWPCAVNKYKVNICTDKAKTKFVTTPEGFSRVAIFELFEATAHRGKLTGSRQCAQPAPFPSPVWHGKPLRAVHNKTRGGGSLTSVTLKVSSYSHDLRPEIAALYHLKPVPMFYFCCPNRWWSLWWSTDFQPASPGSLLLAGRAFPLADVWKCACGPCRLCQTWNFLGAWPWNPTSQINVCCGGSDLGNRNQQTGICMF